MVVSQFIHQLNNTELGRTGTHDCYTYVSKDSVQALSFLDLDSHYKFVYKRDSSVVGDLFYTHTSTGEYRISGCKRFYDAGNVNAGDCIVIERVGDNFWVDFIKRNDVIVFNKYKNLWQCRNEDRLSRCLNKALQVYFNGKLGTLVVESKGDMKKRTQSIKVYSLVFDDSEISYGDVYNLLCVGGKFCLTPYFKDKVTITDWSDHE